ncbi:solute carrier family 26 member 6-like [Gigantopelta aegis]|uniref:solute carrier family 26 member 6-like n=1 Tax=Gigantopelta aegis TaxID=1735272 RepID=UPI001B888118|nr:solute carrier family 26 member 6-like [Gigantopelta aegis]
MDLSLDTVTPDVFETITIKRRVYTQQDLDKVYNETPTPKILKQHIGNSCRCTKNTVCKGILSMLPIFHCIRWYKWRQNLVSDTLAGLSVAFMQLPIGLAMGILSSLKPIYGLYSTFFGIVFYAIFGTSRHMSFGTNAVLSLLTATIVEREADLKYGGGGGGIPSNLSAVDPALENEILQYKVGVAMAAAFMSGLILLVMGLLRFGFITSYLSVSFVGGFTTAAAFHIATSQVSKILGIKVGGHTGPGKIVLVYVDIIKNIANTNVGDLIVGLISMAILLGVKVGINERYGKKMKMPVPIDLIIVITATIISHFAEFERRFGISVVAHIPSGMPVPRLPDVSALGRIGQDSFIIAILAFAMSISMAKLCATLHSYEIDSNQELVAYGATNLLGSFFQCFPMCVAPPRTMLLSSLGAKTTLNAIPTAIFMLVVLLVAGPLFVSLPVTVLAAMIIVAVKNVLLQVRQLPNLWKVCKSDFVIWLVTVIVCILVDLDIGIIVGVGTSVFTVIVQSQFSSGRLVGVSEQEDIYLDLKGHKNIKELKGIKIFYFNTTLFFASVERFKSQLFQKTFNPLHFEMGKCIIVDGSNGKTMSNSVNEDKNWIHHIIIDCSAMTYIDTAGVNVLKMVITQYRRAGTEVCLANCCRSMLVVLDSAQVYDILPKDHVFFSVHDAVTTAAGARLFVVKL